MRVMADTNPCIGCDTYGLFPLVWYITHSSTSTVVRITLLFNSVPAHFRAKHFHFTPNYLFLTAIVREMAEDNSAKLTGSDAELQVTGAALHSV